jgi:cysteine desulfurase
MFFDVSSCIA